MIGNRAPRFEIQRMCLCDSRRQADPAASYNAQGSGIHGQIVETYWFRDDSNEAVAATPDLITHVEVHKMTVHDGAWPMRWMI